MIKKYSVGVDIGGSHITSALVDLKSGTILRETLTEMPVDNKAEADIIIRQWAKAIARSISGSGRRNKWCWFCYARSLRLCKWYLSY